MPSVSGGSVSVVVSGTSVFSGSVTVGTVSSATVSDGMDRTVSGAVSSTASARASTGHRAKSIAAAKQNEIPLLKISIKFPPHLFLFSII